MAPCQEGGAFAVGWAALDRQGGGASLVCWRLVAKLNRHLANRAPERAILFALERVAPGVGGPSASGVSPVVGSVVIDADVVKAPGRAVGGEEDIVPPAPEGGSPKPWAESAKLAAAK